MFEGFESAVFNPRANLPLLNRNIEVLPSSVWIDVFAASFFEFVDSCLCEAHHYFCETRSLETYEAVNFFEFWDSLVKWISLRTVSALPREALRACIWKNVGVASMSEGVWLYEQVGRENFYCSAFESSMLQIRFSKVAATMLVDIVSGLCLALLSRVGCVSSLSPHRSDVLMS